MLHSRSRETASISQSLYNVNTVNTVLIIVKQQVWDNWGMGPVAVCERVCRLSKQKGLYFHEKHTEGKVILHLLFQPSSCHLPNITHSSLLHANFSEGQFFYNKHSS